MLRMILFTLLLPWLVSAQSYGDGVSATAGKVVAVPADQGKVTVVIMGIPTLTLELLLPKVKDAGLSADNLENIIVTPGGSIPGGGSAGGATTYSFGVYVSMDEIATTLAEFAQFGRSNTDLQVQSRLTGVGAKPETLQASQRSTFADLYREAVARTQQMAADAGFPQGECRPWQTRTEVWPIAASIQQHRY